MKKNNHLLAILNLINDSPIDTYKGKMSTYNYRKIAEDLNLSYTTVLKTLKSEGYSKKVTAVVRNRELVLDLLDRSKTSDYKKNNGTWNYNKIAKELQLNHDLVVKIMKLIID